MPPASTRPAKTWLLGAATREIVASRAGPGVLKQSPHERRADATTDFVREANRVAAEEGAAKSARLREARLARDAAAPPKAPARKARKA